jgi:hypothetical protein
MNTTKRQTCNVCKVSLTMDNFKLKRDSTYQKGCEECLKKRRALAKKRRDGNLKRETKVLETPEQRAARIFREDEEIQRKRSEKEAQTSLVTAYKKRTQALEEYKVGKVYGQPKSLKRFLGMAINGNKEFKSEEEEYQFVGKLLKHAWLAMNDELRDKWSKFARDYG